MSNVIAKLISLSKIYWTKDVLNDLNCIKPLLTNTAYGRPHSKPLTKMSCFVGHPVF